MKEKWNERYAQAEYAYGQEPNAFFKEQIDKLPEGKILMPAEGEGRNAIYAAQKGWQADAFDISDEGKKKALRLAKEKGVEINYMVGEISGIEFTENSFDAMGLIYAHFPAAVKSAYHKQLAKSLKRGAIVIFEAFSKGHLEYKLANPAVGGPDDIAMLFSIEEIVNDFPDFEVIMLREEEVCLTEGLYHIGTGLVIRFVGRKK